MGMFLSKYSMLNALGYGAEADRPILEETKRILDKFKLFGLILHDPVSSPFLVQHKSRIIYHYNSISSTSWA